MERRPPPAPSRRPSPRPRRALPACLVCGKPVGAPGATLCMGCIKKTEKPRRPTFPGGARTEHGTRVARAVTCVRCGKEDYLAFKPREAEKHMCRDCTLEVVGLDEHGLPKQDPLVEIVCPQCGRTARVLRSVVENPRRKPEDPVVCADCARGIHSKQGDKTLTGERRRSGVILKRRKAEEPGQG